VFNWIVLKSLSVFLSTLGSAEADDDAEDDDAEADSEDDSVSRGGVFSAVCSSSELDELPAPKRPFILPGET